LYDGTGSSAGPKGRFSAFNRQNHFARKYQKIFIFRTLTNNGFFSGTMASEIRFKVYLLKIDEIYTLNLQKAKKRNRDNTYFLLFQCFNQGRENLMTLDNEKLQIGRQKICGHSCS
jgi:hypothetical protein